MFSTAYTYYLHIILIPPAYKKHWEQTPAASKPRPWLLSSHEALEKSGPLRLCLHLPNAICPMTPAFLVSQIL